MIRHSVTIPAFPYPEHAVRVSRTNAADVIRTLIILAVFATLVSAIAWSFWILLNGMLGTGCAALIVSVLLMGAAACSWRTGSGFAVSLIMVGFAGFVSLTAALYGVAGYALIFGG
jgi:hypothetical protein